MRKLEQKEIQEGRTFHNNRESVRVLRVAIRKSGGGPVQVVVFQEIGSHAGEKTLPMGLFLKQYQRRKR